MLRGLLAALAVIAADLLLSPRQRWTEVARPVLKRFLWTAVVLGAMAGLAGIVFLLSGIFPIAASSGHWAVTRWVLELAKHRSVATHSIGTGVPRLDDPMLVLKGAGHFEGGCRPCHGAPGVPLPMVPAQMTPHPPRLAEVVAAEYGAAELFYIVKHGLKFTGMPAWAAAGRDDEVWAVVAFLQQLPAMEGVAYRRLVNGEEAKVPELVALEGSSPPPLVTRVCARCHGPDGQGRGRGAFPKLAGQRAPYIYGSLLAYAAGQRNSGIMRPIAAALSDVDMREAAEYYSGLPESVASPAAPDANLRGRAIATKGLPEQDVPSCADCHGPSAEPKNPSYPRLAGQYEAYLTLQLRLLRERRRGGTPYVRLMHEVAPRLTDEQIRDVARYYAAPGS